eukprot:tig00021348_g20571.t1
MAFKPRPQRDSAAAAAQIWPAENEDGDEQKQGPRAPSAASSMLSVLAINAHTELVDRGGDAGRREEPEAGGSVRAAGVRAASASPLLGTMNLQSTAGPGGETTSMRRRRSSVAGLPAEKLDLRMVPYLGLLRRFASPGAERHYQSYLAARCIERQRRLLPIACAVYAAALVTFFSGIAANAVSFRSDGVLPTSFALRFLGRLAHAPCVVVAVTSLVMVYAFPRRYATVMEPLLGLFFFGVPVASLYNTLDLVEPLPVTFAIMTAVDACVRVMALLPPRAYIVSSAAVHAVAWTVYPPLGIIGRGSQDAFTTLFSHAVLTGALLAVSAYGAREEDVRRRRDFARAQSLRAELAHAAEEREGLRERNERLHEQLLSLQRERMGAAADLDSPLAKALRALDALRSDARLRALGGWASGALDGAITGLLQSRDVMVPDLGLQVKQGTLQLDRETRLWLFNEVAAAQSDGASDGPEPAPEADGAAPAPAPASEAEGPRLELWGEAEAVAARVLPLVGREHSLDVFELDRATGGHALLAVGLAAARALGVHESLPLRMDRFAAFVAHCETRYPDNNPYHNRRHAADVLLSMAHMLVQGGIGDLLTEEDKLAALLAVIIHDFEHPGTNNNFQVATSTPLALLYNDRSPLESHHASAGWRAMRAREHDFMEGVPKAAARDVRRAVIDVVLATDMARHFEILGNFRKRAAAGALGPPEGPASFSARGGPSPSPRAQASPGPASRDRDREREGPGGQGLSAEDRRLVLAVAMKGSDIGHAFKPLAAHVAWSEAVASEFYAQGDRERLLGLPVSPFMDREKANMAQSQLGFLDFVVLPLLNALAASFPRLGETVLAGARDNYAHWKALADRAAAPTQAAAPAPAGAP